MRRGSPPSCSASAKRISRPAGRPMDGIDRIWVISLERRPERLRGFFERFPYPRGRCSVFEAIDGRTLDPAEPPLAEIWEPWLARQRMVRLPPRGPAHGEAGCALSHLELWRRMAALPPGRRCVVFEDDAFFADRFRERWTGCVAAGFPAGLAFAWLGGRSREGYVPVNVERDGSTAGFRVHRFAGGRNGDRTTHAYLISPAGARQLCERAATPGLDRRLDVWLKHVGLRRLEPAVHTVSPLLCYSPFDYKSDVQGAGNCTHYRAAARHLRPPPGDAVRRSG